MDDWIPTRDALDSPLHASLAAAMQAAIEDGRLPVGARLPPQRSLADLLGLSVHTVSKAYEKLRQLRLVDGQVGRGTYVLEPTRASNLPYLTERGDSGIIDLSISRPMFDALHVERMEQSLAELPVGLNHDTYLACRPNVGLMAHRERGSQWLDRLGLVTRPESVILINGVCHGMSLALSSITRPGDTVVTEGVAHHLIISLCAYLGLRLVGLETDREGVLPSAFEIACRQQRVKVLFTVPTLAGPTVALMSAQRREQLVAIARKHGVLIVEDDAWGPLCADRPPPIASLAPERTLYLTSFTKCTLPGLRAGYLVAPKQLMPAISARLVVFSWMATPLIAELASRWIEDGTAEELARWQREQLTARHAIVTETFGRFSWHGAPTSLHFWLELPEPWEPALLVEHARLQGLALAPTEPFMTDQVDSPRAIRVAVGSVHDTDRFRQGMLQLRDLLSSDPEPLPAPTL